MLYDKTFFISDRRLSLSDDYNYINLSCGKVLSYHKRLKVTNNASCSVILLGDAWSVRDGEISPEKRVQMMTGKEGKELFDIESSWCGRYILIVGSKLYLDATGMMGCFYGDGVISNNISALRKVEGGGCPKT